MGAMCLVADLAVLAGSMATIFGISWYQDKKKRKIRKSIEEKEEKPLEILTEQIA